MIVHAQLVTLHLKFPHPPRLAKNEIFRGELIKLIHELFESRLIKADWDPDEHPRWPAGAPDSQGGQFAPSVEAIGSSGYMQVADADVESDEPEPEINGQTEAESLRASEIDNAAGEARARELGAEAAGEDTRETYQSQIDRQLFARQRAEFWKQEATVAPRLRQLPPDAYTDSNLARMGRGSPPIGEDGYPYELHHPNGLPWEPLEPMTRTDHRLGPNYLLNHPWLAMTKMTDIFVDKLNTKRDFAGVLEADDQVSFFYLYNITDATDGHILGAVQVHRGVPDFVASDVDVRWFDGESKVGVFIKGALRAYFDLVTGKGFPVKN